MTSRSYVLVFGVLFFLVALAHLLRILYALPVPVDAYAVPMLVSWVKLVVPAALAFWAFRISRS